MGSILTDLQNVLTPRARAAGFESADQVTWRDLRWIEYRTDDPHDPILLDVIHAPMERTITAELWRPSALATMVDSDTKSGRRRTWCYPAGASPRSLAHEVGDTVAGWLAATDRS